jgi:hypothetical protein
MNAIANFHITLHTAVLPFTNTNYVHHRSTKIHLHMIFFTHRPKRGAPKKKTLGSLSPRRLQFVRWRLIFFCTILSVSFCSYGSVYQFIFTEHKEADNTEGHGSLRECASCLWDFFLLARMAPIIYRWLLDLGENLWAPGLRIYQTFTTISTKYEQIYMLILKIELTPYKKYKIFYYSEFFKSHDY